MQILHLYIQTARRCINLTSINIYFSLRPTRSGAARWNQRASVRQMNVKQPYVLKEAVLFSLLLTVSVEHMFSNLYWCHSCRFHPLVQHHHDQNHTSDQKSVLRYLFIYLSFHACTAKLRAIIVHDLWDCSSQLCAWNNLLNEYSACHSSCCIMQGSLFFGAGDLFPQAWAEPSLNHTDETHTKMLVTHSPPRSGLSNITTSATRKTCSLIFYWPTANLNEGCGFGLVHGFQTWDGWWTTELCWCQSRNSIEH